MTQPCHVNTAILRAAHGTLWSATISVPKISALPDLSCRERQTRQAAMVCFALRTEECFASTSTRSSHSFSKVNVCQAGVSKEKRMPSHQPAFRRQLLSPLPRALFESNSSRGFTGSASLIAKNVGSVKHTAPWLPRPSRKSFAHGYALRGPWPLRFAAGKHRICAPSRSSSHTYIVFRQRGHDCDGRERAGTAEHGLPRCGFARLRVDERDEVLFPCRGVECALWCSERDVFVGCLTAGHRSSILRRLVSPSSCFLQQLSERLWGRRALALLAGSGCQEQKVGSTPGVGLRALRAIPSFCLALTHLLCRLAFQWYQRGLIWLLLLGIPVVRFCLGQCVS